MSDTAEATNVTTSKRMIEQTEIVEYYDLVNTLKNLEMEVAIRRKDLLDKMDRKYRIRKGPFSLGVSIRKGQRRPKWAEEWLTRFGEKERLVKDVPCVEEIKANTKPGSDSRDLVILKEGEIV